MNSANLIIMKDGATVKTLPIQDEALLGRGKECAIRLEEQAVSRQHALFQFVGNALHVIKKSEFAPLFVNGTEITDAALKEGDVVIIGPYFVKISFASAQEKEKLEKGSQSAEKSALEPQKQQSSTEDGNSPALESTPDDIAGLGGMDANASADENAKSQTNEAPVDPLNAIGQEGPVSSDPALNMNAGFEQSSEEAASSEGSFEQIDDDAKTRVVSVQKIQAKLIFQRGTANVTDFDLTKEEVSIGRGKGCDIVLVDKKASRKNSIVKRAGARFIIQDLGSVNGTYVNGKRIQEHELSGDDLVKIGSVEFEFKAVNADYAAQEQDFAPIVQEEEAFGDVGGVENPTAEPQAQMGDAPVVLENPMPGMENIPGIAGLPGGSTQKTTLLEKFRALPPRTQVIGVVVAALLFWWLAEDDPISSKKAPAKKAAISKSSPNPNASPGAVAISFESLSPEQKQFVENQHSIAFDYYKNREYDKTLLEIEKIFLLVSDYKDSREIQRYAKEGKRRAEAIEEERRKKEEEAKIKSKIAQLVEEAKNLMDKKNYEQAKEIFSEILAIDPDNASVSAWNKQIDSEQQQKQNEKQQKQVQAEINTQGWAVYKEGLAHKKDGKFFLAISTFQRVSEIGVSDKNLVQQAKNMIAACYTAIKNLREPVLKEAKDFETGGEFVKSFDLYKKATRIDPHHPGGYAGMNRIKGVLHDRAKAIYTEAVLAESYSDFTTAQKMYKECLHVAPSDDIYHERAERKLARYFKRSNEESQQ